MMRMKRNTLTKACVAAALLTIANLANAQWLEQGAFQPSDPGMNFSFGRTLSVQGGVALVQVLDQEAVGAAYVFRYDGMDWVEDQKLTASDPATQDYFGDSLSVFTDVALIGALGDDDGGDRSGSAYVFRYDGVNWVEEQKLTASDAEASAFFGRAVSVYGDVALVGADSDDGRGAAYVFRYDGMNWVEEQKLTASDGASGDALGRAVSLGDGVAIVGAVLDDSGRGAAYVFRYDGMDWVEDQKLTASDAAELAHFGNTVSVYDNLALIGATSGNAGRGSAYVFRYDGMNWIQEKILTAPDGAADDSFGGAVSILGDFALVGARNAGSGGAVYTYWYDGMGWYGGMDWLYRQKLTGAKGEGYGFSVALYDGMALVGARGDNQGLGSVHLYDCRSPQESPSFAATNGTFTDRVRTLWTAVPGARGYRVYRSERADLRQAIDVSGVVTGLTFDDLTAMIGVDQGCRRAVPINYYYFVVPLNDCGNGPRSLASKGAVALAKSTSTSTAALGDFGLMTVTLIAIYGYQRRRRNAQRGRA